MWHQYKFFMIFNSGLKNVLIKNILIRWIKLIDFFTKIDGD